MAANRKAGTGDTAQPSAAASEAARVLFAVALHSAAFPRQVQQIVGEGLSLQAERRRGPAGRAVITGWQRGGIEAPPKSRGPRHRKADLEPGED